MFLQLFSICFVFFLIFSKTCPNLADSAKLRQLDRRRGVEDQMLELAQGHQDNCPLQMEGLRAHFQQMAW